MKFADTSWWIAWSSDRQQRHADALRMFFALAPGEQLLTTNLVVGETWTVVRRRASHRTAVELVDRVLSMAQANRLTIEYVTQDQESTAWEWLRRRDERVYSFVDATSFQVMRDRRLREALAFDADFAAAGFVEVRV